MRIVQKDCAKRIPLLDQEGCPEGGVVDERHLMLSPRARVCEAV